MQVLEYILLIFLVVCAVSVSFSKNLLNSIIIFMSYSLVMSIIWTLLFMTLKKIHAMREEGKEE